jgi:hypothetical protein
MPWDPITKKSAFWPHSDSETALFPEALPGDQAEILGRGGQAEILGRYGQAALWKWTGCIFGCGGSGLGRAPSVRRQKGWASATLGGHTLLELHALLRELPSTDDKDLADCEGTVGIGEADLKTVGVKPRVVSERVWRIWEEAG